MRTPFAMLSSAAVLLAACLVGCGKEENLKRQIVLFPNSKNFKEEWFIKLLPNGDTLMHGVNKEYFWNGSTKRSVVWKDGKKDGTAQAWYDNGAVKWQKAYVMGEKTGTWRLFFSDGHPWIVLTHVGGAIDGKVQVWDKTDADKPKEAIYAKGACTGGECGILDPKIVPEEAAPAERTPLERDNESLREFLE